MRRRFGADLPAILITADRSPHVRDAAREQDVQVLSKPLKPAALRALMAQWRVRAGRRSRRERIQFWFAACGHWPSSILAAAITACVRLSTPSFCRIAETCAFTVASDTDSS